LLTSREQLSLEKLETNGTFRGQETEREREARTGQNQPSAGDVCKTSLACSTLGSSAAMLTVVKQCGNNETEYGRDTTRYSSRNERKKRAGQGTWQCGQTPEFIDAE